MYKRQGYDRNGKFVMNKKTLFTDFMPLQDNSKNHIVTVQNNAYFVYGYPVLLSDYVADHEAFLGDFKKAVSYTHLDVYKRKRLCKAGNIPN